MATDTMVGERKPQTGKLNGRLWGARATDWANIQEGQCRPVYEAAFEHVGLKRGTSYLDAGCGAGMAAQIASDKGAKVAGLDASEELLDVARTRVADGDFRLGELENLPFPDAAFDLVTGFNCFNTQAIRSMR